MGRCRSKGQPGGGGGDPAVAVSTQKETAVVEGRVNVKSVSLL